MKMHKTHFSHFSGLFLVGILLHFNLGGFSWYGSFSKRAIQTLGFMNPLQGMNTVKNSFQRIIPFRYFSTLQPQGLFLVRIFFEKSRSNIDRKKPPPGGFPIYYIPSSEPCVRGPPSKDLYQVLRGGSSYTRFWIREHSIRSTLAEFGRPPL